MSEPNILDLFPSPSLRDGGRMPTRFERAAYWRAHRMEVIRAAIRAERWSYSHRQEPIDSDGMRRINQHPARMGRYGSAVLACRAGMREEGRFGIRSGWNFKLRPGESDLIQYHPAAHYKLCSEPDAIVSALGERFTEMHGLVLFSDNMQAEAVSGIFSNVQHPCSDCRAFMLPFFRQSAPIIVARHSLPCDLDPRAEIINDPEGGRILIETWTFGSIAEYHNDKAGRR